MDLASKTSEQRTESYDNISETNTTWILLGIRKDVKRMNKKIDHLETLVRQLKRDSNFFKINMRTLRNKSMN